MKTGVLVKDRLNREVFVYDKTTYWYDNLYNLIKTMNYHKTGKDCDWAIIKVYDIQDEKECYCLMFQESTTGEDWKHDFDFFPKPVKAYKGWKHRLVYHKGFYDEWQSARDVILAELFGLLEKLAEKQKCKVSELKLYITGWSLGASIAPIAAEDCYEHFGIEPVLICYEGANPCESLHTRNYIMDHIDTLESIAFVYSNDFVPRCAPIFGKKLKDIIYYLNDHKCKFPFYFIKKIISYIIDTGYYHCNADVGILKYMPQCE